MSNTGPTGSLDQDRFLQAILQLRNTPNRDCNLLPAEIISGHPQQVSLSFVNRLQKFSNPQQKKKLYRPGSPEPPRVYDPTHVCFDHWPLVTGYSCRTNGTSTPTSGIGQDCL